MKYLKPFNESTQEYIDKAKPVIDDFNNEIDNINISINNLKEEILKKGQISNELLYDINVEYFNYISEVMIDMEDYLVNTTIDSNLNRLKTIMPLFDDGKYHRGSYPLGVTYNYAMELKNGISDIDKILNIEHKLNSFDIKYGTSFGVYSAENRGTKILSNSDDLIVFLNKFYKKDGGLIKRYKSLSIAISFIFWCIY